MRIPYFDAHCDTITAVFENGGNLFSNSFQLDILRLSKYEPAAQVFAVWGGHYREKAALLKSELYRYADFAVFCRTPAEAREAAGNGKVAAFLSVEGAEQLLCSEEKLRAAHEDDGVLMINLCWNSDNALCGSAMGGGGGLTDKGRAFVLAAQEMGVMIDLSHASERAFWEVLEISERQVVASHSN
ncbi:MAG: membrane dipeptidase, partial [Clostridia bacterium]|nr:membrane dipeptidase [Clostridia bacterium]